VALASNGIRERENRLVDETEKWGKVIRAANIEAE
jgi:hypothetical protein